MLFNKLIIIGILVMSISSALAWTDETPPQDNETLNIGFNPSLNESEANNPYPFGLYPEIQNDPLLMSSLSSIHPMPMCTSYKIYKQVWDGSNYVQMDTCNVSITECVDLQYNPVTNMYELPDNWAQIVSNGYMVKKYFQDLINSDSQYCSEWNSTDDEFPDVFYTVIDVDVNDGEEHTAYMYTSLNNDDIETLRGDSIDDYGFATSGRGSDAGSGSIYTGLNIYTDDDDGTNRGMGDAFSSIFYMLIPLLFVLCVFKFILNLMGK